MGILSSFSYSSISESSKSDSSKSESSKFDSSKSESYKSDSKSESSESKSKNRKNLILDENFSIDDVLKKGTPINKLKDKSGTQTVIQKIEDFINKYPKVKEDIESKFGGITNFALILSDKEKFKECFFGDYKKKYIAEDIEEIMVDYNENFS